jgi:hypothetical protein
LTQEELDSLRANAEELKKKVRATLEDENALIVRTPWNAFPDITVQTTVAKLKSHPDYGAAKSGGQDAALQSTYAANLT